MLETRFCELFASLTITSSNTIPVDFYKTKNPNIDITKINDITTIELVKTETRNIDADMSPANFYKDIKPLHGGLYLVSRQRSSMFTCAHSDSMEQLSAASPESKLIFVETNKICDVTPALAKRIAATRSPQYLEQVAKNIGYSYSD